MIKKNETVSINFSSLMIPMSILLVGLMISSAVFFGLKSSQPSKSDKNEAQEQTEVLGEAAPTQPPAPPKQPANQKVTTSIDDDAVLGNKNTAKVAIVEFSDYECSFCKRFRDQTLDQIKKDYINTGKAIFVYRDLPLSFHNPAAENESMAAEAAREQGNDETYFQYHDKIYEISPGNGQGITIEGLGQIADELGLNGSQLKQALNNNKYKEEVAKDAADAAKVGITGTPGFVIGKLNKDGLVEGEVVTGAQPFSVFQSLIDQYLE